MNINKLNNLIELFQEQEKVYKNQEFLFNITKEKNLASITWNEVLCKVSSLAKYLSEKSVTKGDRVMIVSEGRPEWMISDLSIIANSAISVPNYTTYTKKDFEFVLKDSEPKGLIVSNKQLLQKVLEAARSINYKFNFIINN